MTPKPCGQNSYVSDTGDNDLFETTEASKADLRAAAAKAHFVPHDHRKRACLISFESGWDKALLPAPRFATLRAGVRVAWRNTAHEALDLPPSL